MRCLWPGHIGGHHPKETVAQEKDKSGRTAHYARPATAFPTMGARARFATDEQRLPVHSTVDAAQAPRCPLLDDIDHGAACRCRHLWSQQAFALCWRSGYERFVRCLCRKVEGVKA